MRVGTAIYVFVVASMILTGCLRSSTTILVHKNGTATVVDTLMLTKSSVQLWREMAKATKTPLEKLLREQWSDSSFYAQAYTMGPGVTVRSVKFVQGAMGAGYVSIYDAKDVGTLSVNKNSFHDHMSMNDTSKPSKPTYLRFMKSGNIVTVNNMPMTPEPSKNGEKQQTDEELRQQLSMVKKFMGDLELSMRIVVEPGIVSTNASYVQKNMISVIELPFSKVITKFEKDPSVFRLMSGVPTPEPWSLERAFNTLGAGVKMETKEAFQFEMK